MSTKNGRQGESIDEAVLRGAQQIGRPVFFAILIVIAAFIPLLALQGIEGRLFVPLALSIIFSMVGSVLMAFVLAPVAVRPPPQRRTIRSRRTGWSAGCAATIESCLAPIGRRGPGGSRSIWLALTAMSILLFSVTGSEFLPSLDENNFRIRATLPASISLPEATKIAEQLERIFLQNPNVEHAIAYMGRADLGGDPESVSNCEISLPLKPPVQWKGARSKAELEAQLRQASTKIPGVEFEFSQELEMRNDELISGFNTPIAIFVQGRRRERAAGQSGPGRRDSCSRFKGAADVAVEQVAGIDDLDIIPDRLAHRALRHQRLGRDGRGPVRDRRARRPAPSTRASGSSPSRSACSRSIATTSRRSATCWSPLHPGQKIPLSDAGDGRSAPGALRRSAVLNARRRMAVLADVQGRSVGSVVEDAKRAHRSPT